MAWEEESLEADDGAGGSEPAWRRFLKPALIGVGVLVVVIGLYFGISAMRGGADPEPAADAADAADAPADDTGTEEAAAAETATDDAGPSESSAEEVAADADAAAEDDDALGYRVDVKRFVVDLPNENGSSYAVVQARLYVSTRELRDALSGGPGGENTRVAVRRTLFDHLSRLGYAQAADDDMMRDLGAEMVHRLNDVVDGGKVTRVLLKMKD